MSKDEGGNTEITAAGVQVCAEPEVDLARRRALVQAGWAVPAILAVGLPPREAKAVYEGPGTGTFAKFFSDRGVAEANREVCEVQTNRRCDVIEIAPDLFFVADP